MTATDTMVRNRAAAAVPESCRGGTDRDAMRDFFDRHEIHELVRLERFWRDQREWAKLADCYVEDSQVCTTWFLGTGREFAAASQEMFEKRGSRGKHMIWPAHVRINGDRAISESPGTIYSRSVFGGVEVDMMNYARFHSLVVRTERGWRLKTFTGIYQKDTLTAVNPTEKLPVDWEEIKRFRPDYRFLCYTMMQRGYQVSQELPGDARLDIVQAFYAKADRWLETGATPF
jgi:SnoaL-like domain